MNVSYLFGQSYLKTFYVFEAIVKHVVSLISFSVTLSFVYRKPGKFCELILNPIPLFKLLTSFKNFQVKSLGLLMNTINSSENKYTFSIGTRDTPDQLIEATTLIVTSLLLTETEKVKLTPGKASTYERNNSSSCFLVYLTTLETPTKLITVIDTK